MGMSVRLLSCMPGTMNTCRISPPNATRAPELLIEFYSRPGYLAIIRHMIDTLCGRLGYTPAESSQLCLAIDEALCNVIRHGYDSAPDGRIRMEVHERTRRTGRLEILIEDDAKQVDLDSIRSRDLDDVRPGGLGVHLISEIMDDAIYEHRNEGGMRLDDVETTADDRRPRQRPTLKWMLRNHEMEVKTEQRDGAMIVRPEGDIDLSSSSILQVQPPGSPRINRGQIDH